ncbi:transcription initiation factor TFIID subunit 7 isoform X2 [Rosa chinensis]|uniref:transcription initiation factor TFIID subunit 7 isoform X2 n=1 Tax=Rosa chinensis TaxID=74649 RepID=UPI000D08C5B8|nr:transcription initiation factor TFIID subunit 7 isoform X2 [Rosa chinensis]
MEEQFVLRVPPSVAERLDRLLSENASSDDKSLDLSFEEDGRSGTFVIGNDRFPASLLDLPTVVESYKTYDDSVLIKTADIGQVGCCMSRHIETADYPELVQRVEQDLLNISAGGPADNVDIEVAEQEKNRDGKAGNTSKNPAPAPESKTDIPEATTNTGEPDGEPDRSDSDESDDSI